jgi:hypothetical protein
MLIPKSFKVRHKILQKLADKRSEQQLNGLPIENSQLTIGDLSKLTKFDNKLIDQQLNVLWDSNDVVNIIDSQYPNDHLKTKYMILAKGISNSSSKTILNEGQIINSQLFNNYTSSLFQIIVGIIAIWTIYQSSTSIDSLREENKRVQTQLDFLLKDRIESKENVSAGNNYADTLARHQTNFQK